MGGFIGKILYVDLSNGKMKKEVLSEDFYKKWFGGYGLASRVIYTNIVTKADPLGPKNILGLTTGILTGTLVPYSGSFTAAGKSPLTGTWGDSRGGGFFGPELKRAGFDAVFITGRSTKPVYLWISEGEAKIKDAKTIWGKDTVETDTMIKEVHADEKIQIVCIGPSGEEMSRISCIITDKGRAAGRSGLGAIMGSKKLKAVAVRGTGKIPVENIETLRILRKEFSISVKRDEDFRYNTTYGTCGGTAASAISGDSPVKNWAGIGDRDFSTVTDKMSDEETVKFVVKKYACGGCPTPCGAWVRTEKGPYATETHKPEYETLAAFGSMCLNDDLEAITYATSICNRYGIDTISTGAAIAFAMECYEKGILTEDETNGIKLDWRNAEAIVQMTECIAKRERFGAILADGVKIASERIGKGSEKYAIHVRGQELPMHDPRLLTDPYTARLGLVYTSDATPARHTQGIGEHHAIMALGICSFIGWMGSAAGGRDTLPAFVNAVTDWQVKRQDFLVVSNRIATMRQAFNVREGFRPSDFKLPDRVLGKPPMKKGPLAGVTLDIEKERKRYFRTMQWSYRTGRPSQKKLVELGLEDLIEDIY
jgi:aldehyde:ferredoxin oxidoreductase